MSKPKFYPEIVQHYFENETTFTMQFLAGVYHFKIHSLDFGYDAATVICQDESYEGEIQAISLSRLEDVLLSRETPPMRFIYINRWYDDKSIPHYHGLYSHYPTIELAQKHTKFTILACDVDLVYQADNEEDMFDYLHDVNVNNKDADENLDSLGSMDWL